MPVFLSHNSRDKDAVRVIRDRLKSEAIDCWLDEQRLLPGAAIADDVASGLEQADTCAVFFGPSGEGPWHREEIRVIIDRAARARDDFRAIPVLLPGADPGQISVFLRQRIWVDFRSGLDDSQAFRRLVAGIKGVADFSDDGFELKPADPPYRGLERFEKEQAEFFFGRDADIRRMVERLKSQPFLAVVGASGSGKSSLARAGLSGVLARETWPDLIQWKIITVLPGAEPLRALATQCASDLPPGERLARIDEWTARFQEQSHGLRHVLDALFPEPQGRLILMVDQFEELFTHRSGLEPENPPLDSQTTRLIANLADLVAHARDRFRILITLRADFVPNCLEFAEMVQLLGYPQLPLGSLSRDALREVIVLPARKVGAIFEKGLVESILKEAGDQPGSLPLLQHALKELWNARKGPWLTHEAYQTTGGVEGALQRSADATYAGLRSPEKQAIARSIFLRLTSLGEGVSDTRRRTPLDELYPKQVGSSVVDSVIADLSDANSRLIVVNEDRTVEVTHEALIQRWPTLKAWLDANRDLTRQLRELTLAASAWDKNGRDASYLYRGGRLEDAARFAIRPDANLTPLEHAFLEASDRQRQDEISDLQRRTRIQRHLLQVVAVLLIAAMVLAWLAKQQSDAAKRESHEAQVQKVEAQHQRDQAIHNLRLARAMFMARNATDASPSSPLDNTVAGALWAVESLKSGWTAAGTNEWTHFVSELPPPPLAAHQAHAEGIHTVAYAPSGDHYASLSQRGELAVWDSIAHREILRTNVVGNPHPHGTGLAFSPDGKWLAAGGEPEAWIFATRDWSRRTNLALGQRINSMVFSFDGGLFALTSYAADSADLYETTNWSRVHVIDSVGSNGDMAFGPDPAWLFSSTNAWNLSTGERSIIRPPALGANTVLFMTRTPPHKWAVNRDGELVVWECKENTRFSGGMEFSEYPIWEVKGGSAVSLKADLSGECVMMKKWPRVSVLDVPGQREYGAFPSSVQAIAYRREEGHLLTGSEAGKLAFWNLQDLPQDQGTHVLRLHFGTKATQCAFSPADSIEGPQYFVTGWGDGIVRILRTPGWVGLTNLNAGRRIEDLAFLPATRQLLVAASVGTNSQSLQVFSTGNWALQRTHSLSAERSRIEFSALGRWIAVVGDTSIVLLRSADASEAGRYELTNKVWSLRYDASEERLAIDHGSRSKRQTQGASEKTVVNLLTAEILAWDRWDLLSGRTNGGNVQLLKESDAWLPSTPFPPRIPIPDAAGIAGTNLISDLARPTGVIPRDDAVSADGRWLSHIDPVTGNVLVFPQWPEDMIALACARLPRNLTTNEWAARMGTEAYCATCTNLTVEAWY